MKFLRHLWKLKYCSSEKASFIISLLVSGVNHQGNEYYFIFDICRENAITIIMTIIRAASSFTKQYS